MNIRQLEEKYLKAKIAYYEGEPFLSDAEFDALEEVLRKEGSKVIEQVGSKRKDFDFFHPTKMLSLSKIQTEAREDGSTYYSEDQFLKWFNKNAAIVGKMGMLEASPKFDGNAINIIYRGGILSNILTRGDGITGKDITKRMSVHLPQTLGIDGLDITESDIIEIRAEVVIDINLFNQKYASEFANARNYVAGVIGKDDEDQKKVSELKIIPLHYLLNGKHIGGNSFRHNKFYEDWTELFSFEQYEDLIKAHEKLRKEIPYQLDGVVISFPIQERDTLGENDHDPEWALAVKFVPVETITEVEGIEWNISKRGEIIPTLLLKPVFLDGSTVRRASGYNASYIVNNLLGPGAIVSLAKAGDIIPEIQKVITPSPLKLDLPKECSHCGSTLEYDNVHLSCPDESCDGKIAKQLTSALRVLDIKGVGEKTIEPFAKAFSDMYDVITFVLTCENDPSMENFGIKLGSRSHELFVKAFKNIRSLTYEQVIQMIGYENVGKKLSTQLAREHAELDYDYAHLERALVEKLRSPEISDYIKYVVSGLESLGISIDRPKEEKKSSDSYGVCMTGSPKSFGYTTKAEFLSKFPNLYESSLSDSNCKYLVTDDLSSTSSKMKTAQKKGIEIKTYGEF
jgi:DNA ligase (NAD+)